MGALPEPKGVSAPPFSVAPQAVSLGEPRLPSQVGQQLGGPGCLAVAQGVQEQPLRVLQQARSVLVEPLAQPSEPRPRAWPFEREL